MNWLLQIFILLCLAGMFTPEKQNSRNRKNKQTKPESLQSAAYKFWKAGSSPTSQPTSSHFYCVCSTENITQPFSVHLSSS